MFLGKSIKTQLTILLFVLTAVTIGVVGFLGVRGVIDSGKRAEKLAAAASQNGAEQLLVQTTDALATRNGIVFQNIQRNTDSLARYAEQLLNNPDQFNAGSWRFNDHVKRMPAGYSGNSKDETTSLYFQSYIQLTPQIKTDFELLSRLNYLLPQMARNEPNAIATYFIGTQGQTLYYPNISLGEVVPPDYNPTKDEFFTVATPTNNPDKAVKVSKVYNDPAGLGLMLTVSAPVYTKAGEFKGIMGMDISLGNIAKNIEEYSPIQSSYAFLTNKEGRAIALPAQAYQDILGRSAKKDEFGASLKDATGGFASVLQNMQAGKRGFGFVTAASGNKPLYVAYAPVEGTDFSLGIVAEQSVVLQVVSDLRTAADESRQAVVYKQMLPSAIIILAIVWVAGYIYIRYVTHPIIALTEQAHRITSGHFYDKVSITVSSNEIGKLAEAFNAMTAQLAKSYTTLRNKVHELADANAKDDAIFRSIGEGVIVTDSASKVLIVNDLACELLNIAPNKVVGKTPDVYSLLDKTGQPIPAEKRPMHLALVTGRKIQREVYIYNNKGILLTLSVTATPVVQSGEIIGAIQTLRDVTHEREIDRAKTEFISVASHQLRTPLSAIKWFSEMLVNDEAGKLTAEQHEFVQNIAASAARMNDLVHALLNISRIESGRFAIKPEPTDISALVHSVAKDLRAHIATRQLKLHIDIDKSLPKIVLDGHLISQVYINLLMNAIKYTPNGGRITITVVAKNGQLVSTIADTGYGIPQAEQSKVFEKFFRGTNIQKVDTDGTGLGAYLVKTIVESSGGKIRFVSEENKGTIFTFTLPLHGMKEKKGDVTLD